MSAPSPPLVLLNRAFHESIHPTVLSDPRFTIVLAPNNFDLPPDVDPLLVRGLLVHGHTKVDAATLARFPNLLVVSNHGVGIDHISVPACTEAAVVVGNTPDVLTEATADMAFALLLACARRIVEGDAVARSPATRAFNPFWFGRDVHGATLGIVGMGRIGRAIARRGHFGFGMRVAYHNRSRLSPEDEAAAGGAAYAPSLLELAAQSDFLVIAAPASAETRHLVRAEHLAAMPKGTSFLVNIARGTLVDQEALVDALRSGHLAGAGLDVTDPEPLPRDHPLLTSCPTAVITPHTGSATFQTRRAMCARAVENLVAGLEGRTADLPATPNGSEVAAVRAGARGLAKTTTTTTTAA
jgi:glyoxylate reductase